MHRFTQSHSRLVVLVSLVFLLTACGGKATPDPSTISVAVQATLTAIPKPEPQIVEVTRIVEVEVTREVVVAPLATATPRPTPKPRPTPTSELTSLIPARGAYSHSYKITEEFDRFNGTTNVVLLPDAADTVDNPQGSLAVVYHYNGTTPVPPGLVLLAFSSWHDDWQFLECHDLTLLVDGRSMPLETTHDGSVESGFVSEQVISEITLRDFLTIVNANKVEGQLCRMEFELTSSQMEALRDVASRMQP